MELDLSITIILIVSGVIVGAINTLAGGGSVVTVTMFTALGLPITIANGTNRIAVFLQNLTATINFLRKGVFNLKHGLLLSIPVIIGNVVGSLVATKIDDRIFRICFGVIVLMLMFSISYYQFSNPRLIHCALFENRCITINKASIKSGECPTSVFICCLLIISNL